MILGTKTLKSYFQKKSARGKVTSSLASDGNGSHHSSTSDSKYPTAQMRMEMRKRDEPSKPGKKKKRRKISNATSRRGISPFFSNQTRERSAGASAQTKSEDLIIIIDSSGSESETESEGSDEYL